MEKEILNKILIILVVCIFICSCEKNANKVVDIEAYEIDKAIELVDSNKSIKDSIINMRKNLGVEFIPCIIITSKNHRSLGFQIIQSKIEKSPPLKIIGLYKIINVQGVDVLFMSNKVDMDGAYNLKADDTINKLIKKGYVTITGPTPLIDSQFIKFVFCINNDNSFVTLSSDFLHQEEMKYRNAHKSFVEEKYYPHCTND